MLIRGSLILILSGCAIAPDTIRPEFTHMSHLTQHFGNNQQNYYANMFDVSAQWNFDHVVVELAEGFNLSRKYPNSFGEIEGSSEETTVRVGYSFQLK